MTATRWSYAALDAAGEARAGVVDAASEAEAAKIIRTLGLQPVNVKAAKVPLFEREFEVPGLAARIKPAEVAAVIRQLSTMVGAGVTLRRSLSVLTDQEENETLKAALADVRDAVESGAMEVQAMEAEAMVGEVMEAEAMVGEVMEAEAMVGEAAAVVMVEETREEVTELK